MSNVEKMQSDGIIFSLENGALKIGGKKSSVEKWIPFIRENKQHIIRELEGIQKDPTQDTLLSSEAKHHAIELETQPRAHQEAEIIEVFNQKAEGLPLEPKPIEITDAQISIEYGALQNSGKIPSFFTKVVRCKKCGLVWEREWIDSNPETCGWCFRIPGVEIPRPEKKYLPFIFSISGDNSKESVIKTQDDTTVDGGLAREDAEARAIVEGGCFACGGRQFWISIHGPVVCAVCHPPVDIRVIAH